jgi:general stress protein YciG
MPGTKEGAIKARATTLARDPNFYARIGAIGGKKGKADGVIKGFAHNRELAVEAGRKGGLLSHRGKRNEEA